MPEATRTDARRNRDRLLAAAAAAFAEGGTEASLRDVARRAGVGIGTLYRHFPTRETLLEALLGERFDRLAARAADLAGGEPGSALRDWLRAFTEGSTRYRGLPESVVGALRDESSALHASCLAMRTAAGGLLDRARDAGAVRADLTVEELLSLVSGIAWIGEHTDDPGLTERLLDLAMTGLEAR